MKTKARIKVLAKNHLKTLAYQRITNAKAYDEICRAMNQLRSEDEAEYEKMVNELNLSGVI